METSCRQVLHTLAGITIEFFIHPKTLRMAAVWNPGLPRTREQLKKVLSEYLPWRDAIIQEAATKAGKRILVFTPDDGRMIYKVFGPPREKAV